ncbi:hypothetical protein LEM8419_00211 [Neolewinella maritima]|uniref:Uncharacterized protein n=1 Tax=Neolewinella maritima TaxID=1383882 RepID=A0ABM9AWW5_9BACT|nr:hypothetical protein [Neolewinella maritima]CAH0998909.1 hypothetical protein LEM8419_00211 [Neolewinella maritima]
MIPKLVWLVVCLLGLGALRAQESELSNLRERTVAVNAAGQLVDSLTVAPGSLQITTLTGQPVPRTSYTLLGRYLRWNTADLPDSLHLRYRALPFALDKRVRLIDSTQLRREEAGLVIGGYDPYVRSGLLDNDTKVQTRGSFSRAISFGNRQDLVLNSAFNLQLNGELGNGIEVAAAITDENLPVQPEGTTQQLREFDRIFIQLRKDRTQLTAGDYELRNPEGYFMRYYKKLEGATFTTVAGGDPPLSPGEGAGEAGSWANSASIAVARGQFIRQNITPGEGNQGPYKLTGNGAQRFLIVLAGTERVFLDGELLQRGLDADYVIDYNLAELTFTTRRLITRDVRITVEYEYADQRYLRTLTAGSSRYDRGRFSAYLNLYSQQDSKTATGDLELNAAQREALSLEGDSPEGIAVSSIDTLEGREELRTTYALRDTAIDCAVDQTYLVQSNDPELGRYVATFTDRGVNGGPYDLDPDRPGNERVYVFVGYDEDCRPLGRFASEIDLVAPQQQQLFAIGGEYRFKGEGAVRIEGSRSKLDLNRFSRLNSGDDTGHALRVDVDRTVPLGPDTTGWAVAGRGRYEFVEKTFTFINPYRSPEFYRNWNLSNRLSTIRPEAATEQLAGGGVGLLRRGVGRIDYDYEQFVRGTDYTGRRHEALLQLDVEGWAAAGAYSQLNSEDTETVGSFRRPSLRVSKEFASLGGWELSAAYAGERSVRRGLAGDTLSALSFQYDKYVLSVEAPSSEKYAFTLTANQRDDRLPDATELRESTSAREVGAEGKYQAGRNLQLGGNFTYRALDVPSPDLVEDPPSSTFLGRFDVRAEALKRSFTSQTTYQVGSGQEPRVDFQYLYVGPGQGQYIWQDSLYNNDGRIQPNEVELSPFPDIADYIRVSVFNNAFIRTDNVGINQRFNWDPDRLWRGAEGIRGFLRRIALNTAINIDRKTQQDDDIQSWNPFQLAVADSNLVALTVRRRHGLFFNRANPRYDIQLSNGEQRNRRVLTTGYESSRREDWELRFRYRPNDQLSIEAAGITGRRESDSERFNEKDYKIIFNRLEPSVNWQPGEFRFSTTVTVGREDNVLPEIDGEYTLRRELKLESNYRNFVNAGLQWIEIDLENGSSSSPVGFALLQGLQPGRNLLWNVSLTQQLGEYLQLNLLYDGRQTGEAAVVHVGRAQVTAQF